MKSTKITLLIFLISLMYVPFDLQAQMTDTKILGLEEAQRIAIAAHERALQDNWNVVIAIVDAGGHLVYLKRMDGTQLGSIDIAIQKATTSLFYKRPTKAFQDGVEGGNTGILNLPDLLPFEGGLPIEYDGNIIGAIGVSGVTAQQDGIIAAAGLEAL
ncbi:heme-binding protein [soil metagenome]